MKSSVAAKGCGGRAAANAPLEAHCCFERARRHAVAACKHEQPAGRPHNALSNVSVLMLAYKAALLLIGICMS